MSDAAVTNEMLDIAVAAHDAGLCVLPPKQDGSKRPLKAWEQYANTSSTIEEVRDWYDNDFRTGMGLVLGLASNNVECFEFDDLNAYYDFVDLCVEAGLGGLIHRIEDGYLEESPNGIHWLYRCEEVSGNTKLARRPKTESEKSSEHDNVKVLIETRGQGGYAIVAPSHGGVHPSGRAYRLLSGGFSTIETITPEEKKTLWAVARSMDELSTQQPDEGSLPKLEVVSPLNKPVAPPQGQERPGDWFNRTKSWAEILEPAGWTWVFNRGEESYWRRPGKDRDYSGTTNYQGTDVFKVFSSSTPFDPEKSYTKFAAYAVLHHGGDYKAAARAVFPEMPKEARHLGVVTPTGMEDPDRHDSVAPSDHAPSEADSGSTSPPAVGDSWKWIEFDADLLEDDDDLPRLLERDGGDTCLIYAGHMHEFKGLPESGKGWLALLTCRQELAKGNSVVYIDLEDHAKGIWKRLLALGVPHDAMKRFKYLQPETTFGEEAQAVFFAGVRELAPTLVILDSVAEIMAANSLDPLSNSDVANFINMLPRPLSLCGPAGIGPAVVLIDHLTKQNDNTRFSVGAQHKLAAVDGASYVVEAESPLGRGLRGTSRISVVKDRPGHVRRHAEGGRFIGQMIVHANDDGTHVDARLVKPISQTIEGMEASGEIKGEVARYIESQGRRSPSKNEIRAHVDGRNEVIDVALDSLCAGGYLYREDRKGRGGGWAYTSLKPYSD